ncbi:MAG TPA: response regulator [Candidatus Saccharimonadales bacterium]|jgi:two-component system phosphate regulon response regulator PhoB|nr:response regulator [Candidatus Saccharimonadales bacterium]
MNKVLIVEDEPWLSDVYAASLQTAGFAVETVRDGQAAIEAVDGEAPAAIVLDFLLPGGNGLQLLHELQSYADLQTIPVIICSSQSLGLDSAQQKAYGIAKVFRKSQLTPQKLAAAVKDILS